MTAIKIKSLASGELDPSLHARADLPKYGNGLATCRNVQVTKKGGGANRAGTEFVMAASRHDERTRLVPFYSTIGIGYLLELASATVSSNESYSLRTFSEALVNGYSVGTITGITNASPAVVTCTHGLSSGNMATRIFTVSGVGGMKEVNDRTYQATYIDSGSFSLQDMDGNNVDSSTWGTYTSGGNVVHATTAGGYLATSLSGGVNISDLNYCQIESENTSYANMMAWAHGGTQFFSRFSSGA